jgi:nucleoside phosphorylase
VNAWKPPYPPSELARITFGCAPQQLGQAALIVPFAGLESLKPFFGKPLHEFKARGFFAGFSALYQKTPVTVLRSGMGSQRVIDAALALHGCGVKHIAFAGTAGGLHPDMQIGDLFIPDRFVCLTLEDLSDRNKGRRLKSAAPLDANGAAGFSRWHLKLDSSHHGLHASLPSILLLDSSNAEYLQAQAVMAVDLEAAHLAFLAERLGITLTIALTISDLPLRQPLGTLSSEQLELVKDRHLLHTQAVIQALAK